MLALYCIFRLNGASVELPQAIAGSPSFVVSQGALDAAVSDLGDSALGDLRASALAHHRVVAALHSQLTVIPVRYGALVLDRSEIELLLAEKQQHYVALLEEIHGCVEMTIRVRTGRSVPHENPSVVMPPSPGRSSPETPGKGLAYLTRRRDQLQHETAFAEWLDTTSEIYRKPFESVFRHFKVEPAPGTIDRDTRREFLALHFLIPAAQERSFRAIFRRLQEQVSGQTMMSGPWPPYNFVTPVDSLATSIGHNSHSIGVES